MRRRPHVLVLVVGAAFVLLLSAPALGAGVLTDETVALTGAPTIQESPAIAVDPSAPALAAIVADEGTSVPHAAAARSADWRTINSWTASGTLTTSGSDPAGQGDIAWGVDAGTDHNVYAVDVDTSCDSGGGVFFRPSDDSGVTFGSPTLASAPGTNTTQTIEPAIAVDRATGRTYVAFTRFEFPFGSCTGAPISRIWIAYANPPGTFVGLRPLTPFGPTSHYRSPSVAVLPDGRVIVAFRNDGPAGSQIETETCDLTIPTNGGHYCGAPSGAAIGPSTFVGDATSPPAVSGVAGPTRPSVVAGGGRVTVAWHAGLGAVRAYAAMSRDAGATFGPPQQIDPAGPGNQVAPRLAATAGGRVDAAYLWDASGTGSVVATTASAAPPLSGATTEAWGQPVVVQSVPAAGTSAFPGQTPLGRGLGIATSDQPTASPLPATVVAFTDTSTGNQDIHVAGLLHGSTAPVIASQSVTVSKNVNTKVQVSASDADGDPLTWSVGAQPATSGSSVSASDAARGEFLYHAANSVGLDSFVAVATDGVPGHQAQQTIDVLVRNDPPVITCQSLPTYEDQPLVVTAACVSDPNGDPVTFALSNPTGGNVQKVAGVWSFTPSKNNTTGGSFVMNASDDSLLAAVPRTIIVTISPTPGVVTLTVTNSQKTRELATGMALRLHGIAQDSQGVVQRIFWDFDDKTMAQGTFVSHRFLKPGLFTVTASTGNGSRVTKTVKVLVHQRAVQMIGAPSVAGGVLKVKVRTRAAGKLLLRVDSRSQTISVPAGPSTRTLRIQVTSGPLARLSLRLTPSKKAPSKKAPTLMAFRVRRLVLVSPLSAG